MLGWLEPRNQRAIPPCASPGMGAVKLDSLGYRSPSPRARPPPLHRPSRPSNWSAGAHQAPAATRSWAGSSGDVNGALTPGLCSPSWER